MPNTDQFFEQALHAKLQEFVEKTDSIEKRMLEQIITGLWRPTLETPPMKQKIALKETQAKEVLVLIGIFAEGVKGTNDRLMKRQMFYSKITLVKYIV